ncbi:MAG TPA: hypothetical protein VG435_03095 [Acidimicrobiales bacterium]|nr:hypothetical protein [Acidimicrobiales bacterium]
MAKIWYCATCGYELSGLRGGRCHSCREKLTLSALPQLAGGNDDDEVGYRIDGWTDRDRGQLIVRLNDLGIEHRFEDDELVVDAGDEGRVDDLVAALGATAEAGLADTGADRSGTGSDDSLDVDGSGDGDGFGVGSGDGFGDGFGDEEEDVADDDFSASVRLLADAAHRLHKDPTDMQADADVAEASAAVFGADHYGPFDEDQWAAVGRVTRRLLSALGADEALEDQIRQEAGILEKLLAPVQPVPLDDDLPVGEPGTAAGASSGERTVYDLADWLPDQRAEIGFLMDQGGIAYSWEGNDLLVDSDRERDVEDLFDRVAGGGEDEDDDADERRYRAVAELFAACGRLTGDPTDDSRRDAVLEWIEQSEGAPLIGMDEVDWFRIRTRARALATAIEEEHSPEDIYDEADKLHDMLRAVV